ncbi:hypothetical protein [Streptomyces sp. CA-253872]|uniref:hypothetical protein n=1 Tax=Streptomyces sp. CA-253872 TaxID=3240067 RepID=UPI003D929EB1
MSNDDTPQQDEAERVAELQRQAREDYRSGANARAGLDRATARGGISWGGA